MRISFLFVFICTFLLSGCLGMVVPERDINDPENSLVFSYIDMSEAPTDFTVAFLHMLEPTELDSYWAMGVEEGLVFNGHLPNGVYAFSRLERSGFFTETVRYDFPDELQMSSTVRIESPAIYFLGSYRYEPVDTHFFGRSTFTLAPTDAPDETTLLRKLLTLDWVKESQWDVRIRRRLAELQ